jgi:replication fork protection complex subunit Csm3/Swi3
LQRISKSKLKFKGKNHEVTTTFLMHVESVDNNLQFSDIAWLLGTYQVWLHELYPRAKFEDGLALIEKLGHTKRMQQYRTGWINETKHLDQEDLSHMDQTLMDPPTPPRESNLTPDIENVDLGAGSDDPPESQQLQGPPDADEIDQLFAEDANRNSFTSVSKPNGHVEYEDDFADEDDIMRELDL